MIPWRERDLEWQADALLRDAKALGRRAGFGIYRECDLFRVRRGREERRDIAMYADSYAQGGPDINAESIIARANLPARQREACLLALVCERQEEVALAMGVNRPAVSKLLSRARERIIAYLERERDDWAMRLYFEELDYQQSLIYHPPSGALMDARWAEEADAPEEEDGGGCD
jgi:predicted DNA-binding protein (UPF0251 family)